MAEPEAPKTWREAIPYIVWVVLILGFGLEFTTNIVHGNWLLAIISFCAMIGLAAIALHWKTLQAWATAISANWVVGAFALLMLALITTPFVEQAWWSFSTPPSLQPASQSSLDASDVAKLRAALAAKDRELADTGQALTTARRSSDENAQRITDLQNQLAEARAKIVNTSIGSRMLVSLEMETRLIKALREYGTKTIVFSFTSPADNEEYKNAVYKYVVEACHTSEAPCTVEPIIDKSGGIPVIDQPDKTVPKPQYPGIVLHHIPSAETNKLFDNIAVSFGCAIIQKSVTMPAIIEEANVTRDPNLFWIEIGSGYPLNSDGCQ